MNPRRKSRLSIIIFVILGISIATGLVLYALRQNIDLFYTPSEVIEGKMEILIKNLKLGNVFVLVVWWLKALLVETRKVSKFALM